MATGPLSPWYKTARAWNRPLTSTYSRVYDWVGLCLRSALCHHGVHRGNFTLTLLFKSVFCTISSPFHFLSLLFISCWPNALDFQVSISITKLTPDMQPNVSMTFYECPPTCAPRCRYTSYNLGTVMQDWLSLRCTPPLRCVRCHHAGLVNSASVRNFFFFFFFFFLVFFFGAITFVTSHYRAYS